MYLVDYHLHSNNSFDSNATIESVCEAAIENLLHRTFFS